MDAIQAILTRRSIRKYTPETVPDELIDEILHAAMAAPSAGNGQPWHFMVIRDRQLLDEIPHLHPYAEMVHSASVVILVCGQTGQEKHPGFWVQDCSAATQNTLLAAHALGLGAVWVGVFPREERVKGLKQLLGIPEEITPLSLIPIGYPAESKSPSNRYDSSRIHPDRW